MNNFERDTSISNNIECSDIQHFIGTYNHSSALNHFLIECNDIGDKNSSSDNNCKSIETSTEAINKTGLTLCKKIVYERYICSFIKDKPSSIRADNYLDSPAKKAAEIVVSFEKNGKGQLASFYAVYFVEQSFRLREYEQVNRLLHDINVAELTEWSMIALLRSSFSARYFLPAWISLREEVKHKLEAEGKNHKKLLRGLF